MKKKFGIGIFLSALLFFVFSFSQVKALAADSGFTYQVIYPDNQTDDSLGYYYLKMEPGKEQTLEIKLSNPGDKKIAVNVSANGAKTNSNGVIEYGSNSIKEDDSVMFPFKEIVTVPEKIELAAGEEQSLQVKVKMPETSYDGKIAGGIELIEANQSESQEKSGATVINEYAYVVGMVLQETDKEIKPALKLNSVKAGQTNSSNSIIINYSNINAEYLEDMTTEVQISKKGTSTVLYEKKQSKMRMASNTQIDFPIDLAGEKMEAGEYTAKILVTGSPDTREEWTKDFTITEAEANKYNERDVGLVQEKGLNWQLIVLIIVGIFVVGIIIFTSIRSIRKKSKKNNRRKKSKSK